MSQHICHKRRAPKVYLTATSVAGRTAYGADWGIGNSKNSAGHPVGQQYEMFAYLTGIRDVLETAKNERIDRIVIQTFRAYFATLISKRQYPSDESTHQLLREIYQSSVKYSIEPPLGQFHLFRAARKLAIEKCESTEIALFGLCFYNRSRKNCRGSFGVYCATSFANTKYPDIEASVQLDGVKHNYQVQLLTITQTLEMAMNAKYKKITILTRSKIISDLIESVNSGRRMNHPRYLEYIEEYKELRDLIDDNFKSVRAKYCPGGNSVIRLAGSNAWNAFSDDLYMRNGVPVVYTDGACLNNGKKGAVAAAAAYWGPDHPNNAQYRVSGYQSNNRGEYTGPVEVLKKAISDGYQQIIIATDSSLFEKSVNRWIKLWKINGWKNANEEDVKNQDLLKEFDCLREKMKKVTVEFVKGHSGHAGNHGADRLARNAVKIFSRELEE